MSAPSSAPSWRRKMHGYLALARLSNSPTVVSDTLAGAALAGVLVPAGTVWLVAAAMVCFYSAGMYLNDVCDYAVDLRERPGRPLPSGLVSRRAAVVVTAALFAAGLAGLTLVGPAALVAGLVLVALVVVYDLWHKTNPFSPVLMALTRVMVYVTAFVSFAAVPTPVLMAAAALMLGYIVGLTYIAKQEGKSSVARHWPAVLLFLPALYFVWAMPVGAGWLLVAAFAAWAAYSVSFVYRGRIGPGIARLIAGVALLDAMVLAWRGAWPGVPVALAAFGLTLFLQRYIKGT